MYLSQPAVWQPVFSLQDHTDLCQIIVTDESFIKPAETMTWLIVLSTIDFSISFSWKKVDKNIIQKLTFLRYLQEYNTFSTPNWLRSSLSSDVHWLTRWQIKKKKPPSNSLYQLTNTGATGRRNSVFKTSRSDHRRSWEAQRKPRLEAELSGVFWLLAAHRYL